MNQPLDTASLGEGTYRISQRRTVAQPRKRARLGAKVRCARSRATESVGSFLKDDTDFNFHKKLQLHPPLNLLLYLDEGCNEEWAASSNSGTSTSRQVGRDELQGAPG
jgi:hypothetical protein